MQDRFQKPTTIQKILARMGAYRGQMMYWSFYEPRNFDDWIGPYIYLKATGQMPYYRPTKAGLPTVFAAGSILRSIEAPDSAVVWGSGIISARDSFARPLEIRAVRGPLSRARCLELSYPCPEVYGDPGILLPRFCQPDTGLDRKSLGIIPHYKELDRVRDMAHDNSDVRIIDVTAPLERIVSEIATCEQTISSSLHGLIVSHAFGVPAGWVRFEPQAQTQIMGDGSKFRDYYMAFGLKDAPTRAEITGPEDLALPKVAEHVAASAQPEIAPVAEKLWEVCPFRN